MLSCSFLCCRRAPSSWDLQTLQDLGPLVLALDQTTLSLVSEVRPLLEVGMSSRRGSSEAGGPRIPCPLSVSPPVPAPSVPAGSPGGFQEEHRCRLPQPGPFPAGEIPAPPPGACSSLSRPPPQAEAQLGP